MTYTITYLSAFAEKDIPALDPSVRTRIRNTIERKLTTKPEVFGIPLRKSLKGHRKLRVGDYRIVFRIENNTVVVIAILHRSIVYRDAMSRS